MSDPILEPEKITEYLQNSENKLVDMFEMATASFRVASKVPGAEFYFPQEPILEKKEEEDHFQYPCKSWIPSVEENKQNEEINLKEEKKEYIKPKNAVKKQNRSKNFKISGVPDEPSTFPPPIPDDNDPVRNKMLHAWFWAGYYTAMYDAQNKK